LIEPPRETAVAVPLGIERAPAGAAGIAAAEVDVQVVESHIRVEIAGFRIGRLQDERRSEHGDAEILRRRVDGRHKGDNVVDSGDAHSAAPTGYVAFVGGLERFHVTHHWCELFNFLGCGCGVVLHHIIATDSCCGELLMFLDDGRRCGPGIIAVTNVAYTQLLERAEDLRELRVVGSVGVAEVRDDADAGDE
jgi:hypothetical protein